MLHVQKMKNEFRAWNQLRINKYLYSHGRWIGPVGVADVIRYFVLENPRTYAQLIPPSNASVESHCDGAWRPCTLMVLLLARPPSIHANRPKTTHHALRKVHHTRNKLIIGFLELSSPKTFIGDARRSLRCSLRSYLAQCLLAPYSRPIIVIHQHSYTYTHIAVHLVVSFLIEQTPHATSQLRIAQTQIFSHILAIHRGFHRRCFRRRRREISNFKIHSHIPLVVWWTVAALHFPSAAAYTLFVHTRVCCFWLCRTKGYQCDRVFLLIVRWYLFATFRYIDYIFLLIGMKFKS